MSGLVQSTGSSSDSDMPQIVSQPALTPSRPIVPGALQMRGAYSEYTLAGVSGGLYVADHVANRDQVQVTPRKYLVFSDGIVVGDPTGLESEIARLYQATLGRQADLSGLAGWTSSAQSDHVPLAEIANGFVLSSEFGQHNGTFLTTEAFVAAIYRNMFGRVPDPAGLNGWTTAIDQGGLTRGAFALLAADSPEGIARAPDTSDPVAAFVYRMYETGFDRTPDEAGTQGWKAALSNGLSQQEFGDIVATCPEFTQGPYAAMGNQDFVAALYGNALGRAVDTAGLQTWTGMLDSASVSRGTVVLAFANSDEMREHIASVSPDGYVFLPR